jgi:dTDP-glucose 4,6-dehydratase
MLKFLLPELSARLEVIAGNLRQGQAVREAVRGCEIVFHLGASTPYSDRNPYEAAQVNFMGTLNMLMACRDLGVQRLVQASAGQRHLSQHPSPFSASRIAADKLAESFFCSYGVPVVRVRPFPAFGPRQPARAVIPSIIAQALWTCTIHVGNLATRCDLTYVSDTVEGFLRAAEAPAVEGQEFDLGAGQEVSMGEIARKVMHIVGHPVKIVVNPERLPVEPLDGLCPPSGDSQACECLGWQPEVPLEEGLEHTVDWIVQHPELYHVGTYAF